MSDPVKPQNPYRRWTDESWAARRTADNTRWPWPPSKCPVCGGNGLVPNGFYGQTAGQWVSTSTVPEKCRSCDGKGIV